MTPRQRLLAARAAYIVIVLLATLSDLALSGDTSAAASHAVRALHPGLGWRDVIDGLRNVALFAGLGLVWVVTSPSGDVARAIRQAGVAGALLSITVEAVQVFSPVRSASVVDVVTNTLGALAGAVGVALVILEVRRGKGGRSYLGFPAALAAGGYGVAVLCEALTPLFRPALFQQYQGGPRQMLDFALQLASPLEFGQVPWLDVVLYLPAGFLICLWLNESQLVPRGRVAVIALAGAAASFACEYVHGLYGLEIRWEAALAHSVALALGAWLAARYSAPITQKLRGAARARAVIFAWMALLTFWSWRPFIPRVSGFAETLLPAQFIPLAALAQRMDVFSALHVLQQFAIYLPLGCLLGVWPLRTQGRWSHLWPGVALALVLEVGHIVIEQRLFDVTNALLALAGLGTGWIVLRRSGFTPYGAALPAR